MKAIDKVVELLPIPALVTVALIVFGAWLIKEYQRIPDYGGTLRSPPFQALVVVCTLGLLLFYALDYIFAIDAPFGPNEKGILISQFPHDEKALVQEQTLQVLINRRDQNKNLANVKFRARSRQVAEEDAQKTMDQTKALGLISGTVIPSTTSTLVWFKWAWTGNTQVARLQAPLFPNIDDFLAQYMQQLEKTVTPSGTGTFAVENATAEALTRENQRLRAELINLRAGSGDPTPQALNIKRYAIAIGNSAYEHIPNLRYAIDDALAFANAIQRGPEGVAHSNVTILFNASRQSTLSAIDNLTHQATPGSYIYFYYSGHSLSQGGKSFIVPVDSNDEARTHNAIAIAEILQMLSTAPSAASIFFFSTVTSTSLSCAIDDILGLV